MELKVNDKIKCHGIADLIDTMYKLAKENVETDFSYEQDGEKGYWLIVTKIGRKKGEK
jgi:hypothetical protein